MIDLTDYIDVVEEVKITFTDNSYVIGKINSVDSDGKNTLRNMKNIVKDVICLCMSKENYKL